LLITVGFSGLYGTQALLATSFATIAYVLIISNFQLHSTNSEKLILVIGTFIVTFISWWAWGRLSMHYSAKVGNRLTKQLETSEEKSQIIIQSIGDGVIVFDKEGKITLTNAAAASLTEWSVQDTIGLDVRLVIKVVNENGSPLADNDDIFSMAIINKQNVNRTLILNGHLSKQTIVSLVISPLLAPPDNEAVGGVAVIRDVTKDKQREKQSADFISTASHEMRTPIAAIQGYLELALNPAIAGIDDKARNFLQKAHESTRHLGQLFQDLLTSAKAEDGHLTNHPVVIEAGAFLRQLAESLRLVAEEKKLTVAFNDGTNNTMGTSDEKGSNQHTISPLYYIKVDPDRIQEVMTNLFDNAVKYTPQGKITIGLSGNKDIVQISISDTGQGIPAEDIPHLFQKFYRVDNAETRAVGGTGLGLFICAKIIELYQGRIWVDSKLSEGSTFYINIPRIDTVRAQQLLDNDATANPAGSIL
jgi:PAS domain S-box-containing protein